MRNMSQTKIILKIDKRNRKHPENAIHKKRIYYL